MIILLCIICCCLLGGFAAAIAFLNSKIMVYPDPYISELPDSARNIQEESVDLFPDWAYYLKAEIEADDFPLYVQALSLKPYTTENSDESIWINWSGIPFAPDWWDPSSELSGTYLRQDGDLWVFAKYENGYLYLMEFTH
jgi:hypothetical protein